MEGENITEYKDAEAFLYDLPKFTTKNSLDHTRLLLAKMGDPAVDMRKVHVAGTNGKGSVCAYLQGLLIESGYKVGGFISPHLMTMHERFLINKRPVGDERFMESFHLVKKIADEALREGLSYPTFFEFLFLMGMDIFRKEEVEVLVLETGLGGRLDATNVFEKTDICVITSIGLDHCQYLGDTREEIAFEKAGIIKKDASVIFEDKKDSVGEMIWNKCKEAGATPFPLYENEYSVEKIQHKTIDFSYHSRYYNYISLIASTNALYQVQNAALALRAFEILAEKYHLTPMSLDRLEKAVASVQWEGRMEEVLPDVYFDGAHNEDGIKAFLETVKAMDKKGRRILCFSAVEDKAYKSMVDLLGDSGLFDAAFIMEMEEERSAKIQDLEDCFFRYRAWQLFSVANVEEGICLALQDKKETDQVFIVGSLYLVGQVKSILRRKHNDQF
ncbi:MAG: bifunctional folylpolyglutamate synthase/dihydrofolate synthase [Lachnospiraceae bacterium]|nr:bifunctional folylpolyglutamate synthase/dihydrofolate synthase [Lachnospiraceae bacterium]